MTLGHAPPSPCTAGIVAAAWAAAPPTTSDPAITGIAMSAPANRRLILCIFVLPLHVEWSHLGLRSVGPSLLREPRVARDPRPRSARDVAPPTPTSRSAGSARQGSNGPRPSCTGQTVGQHCTHTAKVPFRLFAT